MKIVAIGDIHGLEIWQDIVKKEHDADLFIFLGDYVDSHDRECNGYKQRTNLLKILDFKHQNPEKVILLFGNHDLHYLKTNEKYSGFQHVWKTDFREIFENNLKDFQIVYQYKNFVFSHAGITKTWYRRSGLISNEKNNLDTKTINEWLHEYRLDKFLFLGNDMYGYDNTQGPLWVRPPNIIEDKFPSLVYIMGHTNQSNIDLLKNPETIFIDTLSTSEEYLTIKDDKLYVEKLR